jgi:hypothetical protein
MISIRRPLLRIFGDIRAFQCQPSGFTVLLPYLIKLTSTVEVNLDAADLPQSALIRFA